MKTWCLAVCYGVHCHLTEYQNPSRALRLNCLDAAFCLATITELLPSISQVPRGPNLVSEHTQKVIYSFSFDGVFAPSLSAGNQNYRQ